MLVFNKSLIQTAAATSAAIDGSNNSESLFSKCAAASAIIIITAANCIGVRESTVFQNVLTSTKVILVLILFLAALVFAVHLKSIENNNNIIANDDDDDLVGGINSHIAVMNSNLSLSSSFKHSNGVLQFFSSLIACLWSFDGWADLNFMSEELRMPNQLPKIIFTGLAIVTVCYILANISFLIVLSAQSIITSPAIGYEFGFFISTRGDPFLPLFFAAGVALSTCGSLNGSIMTGGRAFYAVARDGKAPKFFSKINSVGSPYTALIAQGVWSLVLLSLPGSNFQALLNYFGPASWCFYAFTSSSVIALRYKYPNLLRPFKVPFYPFPPLIVISIALTIVVSALIRDPFFCLLSFAFILLSVPVHIFFFERKWI